MRSIDGRHASGADECGDLVMREPVADHGASSMSTLRDNRHGPRVVEGAPQYRARLAQSAARIRPTQAAEA
jgi:hypothetical protein